MKLKPHLVLRYPLTGWLRPVDRLLAFLDMLLGGGLKVICRCKEGGLFCKYAFCRMSI
jgi:hypothetical protein